MNELVEPADAAARLRADADCFIERQFPVAKVSAESYKERKAVAGQTLTGLGKWWGRKPLVLVRATILGLLLPATDEPAKDREVFLKLMTMDPEGLRTRKSKTIPAARLLDELTIMPPSVRHRFLESGDDTTTPILRLDLDRDERRELQRLVFDRMAFSEKLQYCDRPEEIDGPSDMAWAEINAHLDTNASSIPDLVEELGRRRFGHRPRVGDSFCGGGSIPFEAARIGCDAYGSDLNPVAALLTWAALNIVGGGEEVAEEVQRAQEEVFAAVDRQITEWGIEHNEKGWRADAYLYCTEVIDPESAWRVPLVSSWVIAEKPRVVARLVPDKSVRGYRIKIVEGISPAELKAAKDAGTARASRLYPPDGGPSTPIEAIRRNLRMWQNADISPRSGDVFQERLYCIRWVETYIDEEDRVRTRRHYRAPAEADLQREARVLELLNECFADWQAKGYIPRRRIEPGAETTRLFRERGWTHWHHLFTPRQLLVHGLIAGTPLKNDQIWQVARLLFVLRCANWNSRLCRWLPTQSGGAGGGKDTYFNNALNTLMNYTARGLTGLQSTFVSIRSQTGREGTVAIADARQIREPASIWITDPPYADAVKYDELSEFFIAWCDSSLLKQFPDWWADSKRALAVTGNDESFHNAMVECYRRLTELMTENGLQVVMFTHQDAAVWADLALILWAAGLHVTAAWCIATETDAAVKEGNYVQGTVLLVLRKRTETESVFLDEITHRVEEEVKRQLDSMLALEDDSDPNFGDADYQLAAYAAALRVLTERPIEEIDPAKEITRPRGRGEVSPVERLIRNAVKIACDHLVPRGLDGELWKTLSPLERFYIKGLEVESHGEHRNGVYQELARGFGAADYDDLLASTRANETRLKTSGEFGSRMLSGDGFAGSLLRHVLFAIHKSATEDNAQDGLNWLRTELEGYWQDRERAIHILDWLGTLAHAAPMAHWVKDAGAARLLAGAVRNDHI